MESDDFGSFTGAEDTNKGLYYKCRVFLYVAYFAGENAFFVRHIAKWCRTVKWVGTSLFVNMVLASEVQNVTGVLCCS